MYWSRQPFSGLLTGKIDSDTKFEPGDFRGISAQYQGNALKEVSTRSMNVASTVLSPWAELKVC